MTEPHDGKFAFDDKLRRRIRQAFHDDLDSGQQSAVLAWASFVATFGITRGVTHWIRAGHGPKSGGMSVGGKHFHHYNLGIAILAALGGLGIRGIQRHVERPAAAIAYGIGTGLIVDEAALLLDLEDVYWSKDGRKSVDIAIALIALGGLGVAGSAFWPDARREVAKSVTR